MIRGFRLARVVALATVVLGVLAAPSSALEGPPAQVGQWGPVLNWPVQGKHMVLLHTGKVLVWAKGQEAHVFNPATGQLAANPAPSPFVSLMLWLLRRQYTRRRAFTGGRSSPPR